MCGVRSHRSNWLSGIVSKIESGLEATCLGVVCELTSRTGLPVEAVLQDHQLRSVVTSRDVPLESDD